MQDGKPNSANWTVSLTQNETRLRIVLTAILLLVLVSIPFAAAIARAIVSLSVLAVSR